MRYISNKLSYAPVFIFESSWMKSLPTLSRVTMLSKNIGCAKRLRLPPVNFKYIRQYFIFKIVFFYKIIKDVLAFVFFIFIYVLVKMQLASLFRAILSTRRIRLFLIHTWVIVDPDLSGSHLTKAHSRMIQGLADSRRL